MPAPAILRYQHPAVYPRECGGTRSTRLQTRPVLPTRVYPRECGGTPQFHLVSPSASCRSIPASAGEPSNLPATRYRPVARVYPRECGGTFNRNPRASKASPMRSIPASAGEPTFWSTISSSERPARQVYPRECGGTCLYGVASPRRGGLSPRVRGNPITRGYLLRLASRWRPGLSPRVRGTLLNNPDKLRNGGGLSPRVRGNHVLHRQFHQRHDPRSIPASAGEPR